MKSAIDDPLAEHVSDCETQTVARLRTRCSECNHPMTIGLSISMQMGWNSGHVTCPKCRTFLHVEQLEGDEASTEPFSKYLARQQHKFIDLPAQPTTSRAESPSRRRAKP